MTTLAVYTYTRNCKAIDYPFVESIQSSLMVADRVFVCDCYSDDGTWEVLQAMAATDNRIEVMRHPWGDHYRIQGQVCNGMLERIDAEGYNFSLQVQADEIVCEWTIPAFRSELNGWKGSKWSATAAPKYRHFCPDYRTTWPFIYEHKAVAAPCRKGWRYDANSDACSLPSTHPTACALELHHIGKVSLGREEVALKKELEFQEMYRSIGFPDPKFIAQKESGKVDYRKAFEGAVFSPYKGPHPAVLIPRIARAEGRCL